VKKLCRDFPRDHVPLILTPLLYLEESEITTESILLNSQNIFKSSIMDTSWSKMVLEIGYAFTSSTEECKSHLMKAGGRDVSAQDVAKIISLMCQTHTNLSDSSINLPTPNAFWSLSASTQGNDAEKKDKLTTIDNSSWKPDIFVQTLKEVVPNLNWKEVCWALDHPEFMIKDRAGLNLLVTTIRLGMQASGIGQNFPAECIYRHWTNVEGQLTLITAILKSPDIYSFADHLYTSVPVEVLKTPPEPDNKEINSWKSVHLVEVLLFIAENGFYNQVLEIIKYPLTHCPDILFMGLLQTSLSRSMLRDELFTTLVPIFLNNHPNSGPILHHAWNSSSFGGVLKNIIMMSMSDWYLRGDTDQSRLSRILDLAQDLKALSNLLNSRTFMFVIDLACLASRREYLKLDKWLSDKLREHGDQFVAAIIKFIQRRCPQIMGKTDDQLLKSGQLQTEIISTIVQCLHVYIPSIHSPEIGDQAAQVVNSCNLLLNKRRQFQTPMLRGSSYLGDQPFGNNQQVFNPAGMNLSDLSTGMNTLNLNPSVNPNNSSAFNFGNMIGSLTTPASPSRLMNAAIGGGSGSGSSNSPFPMGGMSGGPQNMGRVGSANSGNDKLGLMNQQQNPNQSIQSSIFTDQQAISHDIEEEANGYFQRIYNHPPHPTLTIDEVLEMLKRFQESSNKRERDVHYCMLRNLLEEYKFFPQYPDKELQTTAQLFGGMIEKNLVDSYVTLGHALKCVLDALRRPEGTKMFYFGVTALDRFKNKLNQYQKYCEHIRGITHFNSFPAHLIKYVEYGCNSEVPPDMPQFSASSTADPSGQLLPNALSHLPMSSSQSLYRSNSVTGNIVTQAKGATTPSTTPSSSAGAIPPKTIKSIANATNIDTLLVANESETEKITMPPDSVQDKIAFIFNNLSQLNLTTKCEEIKEILLKEYFPWMARYLVLKRASIEINFHTLYSNFLDALKMNELLILTTNETFK
jgi:CCR4-NOT transcription complex subunit 1